jgi:hypothetical protein
MKRAILLALLLAGCQTTEERLAADERSTIALHEPLRTTPWSAQVPFVPNEPMESLIVVDAASTQHGLNNPKLMAVANQMKVDAPSSASLFTAEKSPCRPDMPLANEVSHVYSFKSDGAKYWLVQAECVAGSAAISYSAHFLVGTRYPAPIQLKVKVNETRDLLETEGYGLIPFQLPLMAAALTRAAYRKGPDLTRTALTHRPRDDSEA